MIKLFLLSLNLLACTDIPINGTQGSLKSVLFQPGDSKEFCLKLPQATLKPGQNPFVELSTVNKGNASCGVLNLKFVRPNKNDIQGNMRNRRCVSKGVQPGCVLVYTAGRWNLKMNLVEPCRPGNDRWDINASWNVR